MVSDQDFARLWTAQGVILADFELDALAGGRTIAGDVFGEYVTYLHKVATLRRLLHVPIVPKPVTSGCRAGPYSGAVTFPKPIRVDADLWLVMRSDPVAPKAGIQRLRDKDGAERFLLIKWDTDPAKRVLMGVHSSLNRANEMVLFDNTNRGPEGPPNGRR